MILEPTIKYSGPESKRQESIKQAKKLIPINDIVNRGLNHKVLKKYLADGTFIKSVITEGILGRQELLIIEATGGKVVKKPGIVKYDEYVLLVEMHTNPSGDIGTPGGFAIFAPTGRGYVENEETEVPNLKFIGWTNSVDDVSLDPLGITGQETIRTGWCNEQAKDRTITQLLRVDQGYVAYDGDEYIEEVTMISTSSDIWTYEDIPFPNLWESVDPGPPPEAMCGYTWDIATNYGGPGVEDFHDEAHLFYHIESGGKNVAWWPPNFTQYIKRRQEWNHEGCLIRMIDDDAGVLDLASDNGVMSVAGDVMMPGTFTKYRTTYDWSSRLWGIVWGTYVFAGIDAPGETGYPYLEIPDGQWYTSTMHSDYVREWMTGGVYVKDRYKELFINGLIRLRPGSALDNVVGYKYYQREEIIPADAFDDPSILTEEQLAILAGNESMSSEWVYDIYTTLYYITHSVHTTTPGQFMINCGGREYHVKNQIITGLYSAYGAGNDWYSSFSDADIYDYGIFTEYQTGIVNKAIVASNIKPVYAYSMIITESQENIVYGLVINGRHYRTEELIISADSSVSIPEISVARDKNGNIIRPTGYVRTGIILYTKKEI